MIYYGAAFMNDRPTASIVMVASAGEMSVRHILSVLRAQNIANELEIVISARENAVAELSQIESSPFFDIQVVTGDFTTSARARVPAVLEARGDIIIFCEDHCFPTSDDWAEKIITPLAFDHAAVGPTIENSNPNSAMSWANLLIEYGPWVGNTKSEQQAFIPGHNSCYKTAELLSYGDQLGEMLEVEWVLHRDLVRKGKTLWVTAEAACEHLNFSLFRQSVLLHFFEGWSFAASRALEFNAPRRLTYGFLWPAIFLIRFWRVMGMLIDLPISRSLKLKCVFATALLLQISALGEGFGYLLGEQKVRKWLGHMEYERWKNIRPDEARAFYT